MLVVVHHRNVALLLEVLFDFEAFGRFDVLKVDASESGCDGFHDLNEFLWVLLVDFDVEAVKPGENLEQERLSFHYGFSCESSYVAQSQHSCAVADYGHEIALVGIFVCVLRLLFYFETGVGNTRRICKSKVLLS